ncbi:MAG: hypothetical protein IPK33_10220 [Gemmatimonadetes bacterium]|nr:hypothetical protein [Gemmatimonadota bacterium]
MELVPFRAAIDAGAALVMSAHIALPALEGDSTTPATLAPRIMTGLLRDTLGFRGVAITDALTMDGVGKGYGVAESTVLAVKAGADILLKPSDPTQGHRRDRGGRRARRAVAGADRRVGAPSARAQGACGRGVQPLRLVGLVAPHRGGPAHRATANDIARRAVTLLRDRGGLVPLVGKRTLVIQYMPETELRAGRAFAASLRAADPAVRVVKLSPSTAPSQLDALAPAIAGRSASCSPPTCDASKAKGAPPSPRTLPSGWPGWPWPTPAAARQRLVFVSFGNPYLLRQLPAVGRYLGHLRRGRRAGARALPTPLAGAPITGTTPCRYRGSFRGDGIRR